MMIVAAHRRPARALDWACACMAAGIGLVLAMPGDTLAWSPAFEPLLRRAPETVWAAGMILLGVVRIVALIINGRMPTGSPVARGAASALSFLVWSQFFIGAVEMSLRFHVTLLDVAIYLVLLGCETLTIMRSTRDLVRARQCRGPR